MPTGDRYDPYTTLFFKVEIQGVVAAHFTHVSGLRGEAEVLEYAEGGENSKVYKLPGPAKHSNLVLKGGIATSKELHDWWKTVENGDGKVRRIDGSIILLDDTGAEKRRWNFHRAWPCKWEGPEFSSDEGKVAVETLELAHEGIDVA